MPKNLSLQQVADLIVPGMRVLLHAGPVESLALRDALAKDPARLEGVTFTGLFIPGINDFDYAGLGEGTRQESLFAQPALRAAFAAGRLQHLPMHYSQYPGHLARHPADLAILHLPPAQDGAFSCGLAADVAEGVRRYARRLAVLVNPDLPRSQGGMACTRDEVEAVAEVSGAPAAYPSGAEDPALAPLVARVAALIEDGDTVQVGIGRLPAAILRALKGRRRLRMYSGMVIDEVVDLAEAGAFADPDENGPVIVTGIALGTEKVHRFAAAGGAAFHGVAVTHDLRRIAANPRFAGINSAVEVDLLGQINCERVRGRQMSGVGGAGDFARAARFSEGGRAILVVQAEAKGVGRIVPCLPAGATTLARSDIDILVTEHGTAALRDLSLDARAEAIIALAGPGHRAALADAWRRLRAEM